MASDYPPEPIYDEKPKEPVVRKSFVFCEHANECPHVCPCKSDCACKETMCKSRQAIVPQLTPLPEKHIRPLWHETWMETAHAVGKRSYDPRLQVGAIVVSDDNSVVLSLGYNGNFAGGPNVPDSLEPGQSGFIHAEANCLIKCPYHFPTKKVMYVTHSPCKNCAKMIVNAGIARVIYDIEYRDTSGIELMRSVGILVEKFSDLVIQR
jgi:dCMP deaminase